MTQNNLEALKTVSNAEAISIGPPVRFGQVTSRKLCVKESHSVLDRKALSNMTIAVIGGECVVEFANRTVSLKASESIDIPGQIEHSIVAKTDLKAIVSYCRN